MKRLIVESISIITGLLLTVLTIIKKPDKGHKLSNIYTHKIDFIDKAIITGIFFYVLINILMQIV